MFKFVNEKGSSNNRYTVRNISIESLNPVTFPISGRLQLSCHYTRKVLSISSKTIVPSVCYPKYPLSSTEFYLPFSAAKLPRSFTRNNSDSKPKKVPSFNLLTSSNVSTVRNAAIYLIKSTLTMKKLSTNFRIMFCSQS